MNKGTQIHADKKNRTVICTVLFADIVRFSEMSVGNQTVIKEHFNQCVNKSVSSIAEGDKMMLDTGDGIAICLFGDPEQGMFLALELGDEFKNRDEPAGPGYLVRIGLNLGPVKVVVDVNNSFNVIGDGINVAQRVMNFAQPGQVLCSRSYFEIVSRLSDDFARLFEYCGIRHDKHVREHDVYEVKPTGSAATSGYDLPEPVEVKQAGAKLSDETESRLIELLARYEGPMAKLTVRLAVQKEVDFDSVVSAIAGQMNDSTEGAEFIRAARKLV